MQPAPRTTVPWWRASVRRTVALRVCAGMVLAAGLMVGSSSCTATRNHTDTSMPAASDASATSMVTAAPLETATTTQTIPVYWLGRSVDAVYLYREFLPTPSADDPIVAALEVMMAHKPRDPDYFSVWSKPTRLGASISAKNVITVDVSADAFAQHVDEGIAERSVSQLVYTATAAAAMAGLVDTKASIQVSVLVDGHTAYNAFGHVPLDRPLTRNPGFLAPVWVIDPDNGSTYKKLPLKVLGQGISPTGVLNWSLSRIHNGAVGALYSSGTVTIPEGPNVLGEFSFNLVPPPGRYELAVYLTDPSKPGLRVGVDTKVLMVADPTGSDAVK